MSFLIVLSHTPEFKPEEVPLHIAFIDELKQKGQLTLTGRFLDQAGGAYLITVPNHAEAEAIAYSDPLYTSHSSTVKIYEWDAH